MTSRRSLVTVAEGALVTVTVAAVLGMGRLFDSRAWMVPLLVNAVAAHLVAVALRRRGLPLPRAGLLTGIAAALALSWTTYWSTTAWGVPTGATWSAAGADLRQAWTVYGDVVAPAPVEPGFVVASCIALWLVAFLADWAAFRLWVPFEATLPAGTLFLFTALVGAPDGRSAAVAGFGGAVLAFLLVHRLALQDGTSHWVADRRARGNRSLLVAGGGLTVVAVLVGTLLGPSVPGAQSPGLLDPRALRSDGGRVTVSPLVDIRSRLVNQAKVEVFTVRSPVRSYWRLTSLDRFDGRIWRSSGTFGKASGELPEGRSLDVATETFDQDFTIEALAAIWLPSAFEPRAIVGTGSVDVRYDEDSSTLIVDNDERNSDDLTYRVTSASPRLLPTDLLGPTGALPSEIEERYLALPSDFSVRVRELAAAITERAGTPADQARALQDYLRTFTYSLDVQPGHSESALEDFLFATKTGYCEQFAGAFAAMARSLGLPARVAVGFTPGEEDPDVTGLYRVRGEYAHAWPEVFIAGAGWIAYEPTPGRGIPNAESYTGVPDQQAAPGNSAGGDFAPTTVPGETIPSAPSTTVNADPDDIRAGEPAAPTTAATPDPAINRVVFRPMARALPIAGVAVLAYLIAFPLGLLTWRALRRRRAVTPRARIGLAWRETAEAATALGYVERPSDTYLERAQHLARCLPTAERPVLTLARTLEAAAYSAHATTEDDVARARAAADEISATAHELTPRAVRVRRWLDARSLLRSWRRDRQARHRQFTLTARGDLEQERELVGSRDRG